MIQAEENTFDSQLYILQIYGVKDKNPNCCWDLIDFYSAHQKVCECTNLNKL